MWTPDESLRAMSWMVHQKCLICKWLPNVTGKRNSTEIAIYGGYTLLNNSAISVINLIPHLHRTQGDTRNPNWMFTTCHGLIWQTTCQDRTPQNHKSGSFHGETSQEFSSGFAHTSLHEAMQFNILHSTMIPSVKSLVQMVDLISHVTF